MKDWGHFWSYCWLLWICVRAFYSLPQLNQRSMENCNKHAQFKKMYSQGPRWLGGGGSVILLILFDMFNSLLITWVCTRFIEGDFDTYVSQMRKPHVWGGEPELLMLSHVLRVPITVYMHDNKYGGLISIAEYGQEYGTDNPIRVLYHGYGHYDALLIPGNKGAKSRL